MLTVVAGTRPNFMKIGPIVRELARRGSPFRLVHTGQHFDAGMSDVFFRDLGIPAPHVRFEVSGSTHGEQTASILVGIERDLVAHRPFAVLVVGVVTSTFAAALAASKLLVPVVHVEAGLRSRDFTMPEEINRVLTDQLSDLLLIPSEDARPNLLAEGIDASRIVFVGNVMIDSLHATLASPTDALSRFGVREKQFGLLTLHRPANVDDPAELLRTLEAVEVLAAENPLLFPVHPRTRAKLDALRGKTKALDDANVRIVEPLGHKDFVTLMARAKFVATDSGGIQEETTALQVPCLTMREGTERPITVDEGTNVIVGRDLDRLRAALRDIHQGLHKKGRIPHGWDGHAAKRIVDALEQFQKGTPKPKKDGARA